MKIQAQHEDLIYQNQKFIQELAKVQESYFETLCSEMKVSQKGREWLSDYIYNNDQSETFEEYLDRYNCADEIYLD